jgi:hypothetical protein
VPLAVTVPSPDASETPKTGNIAALAVVPVATHLYQPLPTLVIDTDEKNEPVCPTAPVLRSKNAIAAAVVLPLKVPKYKKFIPLAFA